ncbi:MAG TPA: enolase C-terminal domain-like protein [Acidimicrobiales bacterium]
MTAIAAVDAAAYTVPTDQPEADGTLAWDATTVVVASVRADDITGVGWTYTSRAAAEVVRELLAPAVIGGDPIDVTGCYEQMVRAVRNVGRVGIAAAAVSAVDIAIWDLRAKLVQIPLAPLLGRVREHVPMYGSGGFTTYDDATMTAQLEGWLDDDGLRQVKIKIGEHWGSQSERDLARVRRAREVIGDRTALFVDANGAYTAHQAVRLGRRMIDEAGIAWFEEPVSSDDLAGLREVRRHLPVDIAAGEYGDRESYFERMLAADAVDCLQIDVTRCGGYTAWLRAAALAGAHNIEVSGHCAPNLHAPVAAAVPNLRHVELFHDHRRVDAALFAGTLRVTDGYVTPQTDRPGHGMALKGVDAERYRVD